MQKKRATSFRLTDEALQMLAAIAKDSGIAQTSALELMIRDAARSENSRAAVQLGRRGAKARLKKLTPEKRSEVARTAAAARWGRK
jgi:hypothetical protein